MNINKIIVKDWPDTKTIVNNVHNSKSNSYALSDIGNHTGMCNRVFKTKSSIIVKIFCQT